MIRLPVLHRPTHNRLPGKARNDRDATSNLAFHGKGGDISMRRGPGSSANTPVTQSAERFQVSRRARRRK
jgi:hypothetical protein